MADLETKFDKILRRAVDEDAGGPEFLPGIHALPLVPRQVRLLPNLWRAWSKIEKPLVDVFKALATGKASWPLLLHGAPGAGKTCAALAMADIVATATYTSSEDLCDSIMGRGHLEAGTLWDRINSKDLVVLDELGCRSNVGDLEYTSVKRVLDIRETKHHRTLIAISNVAPDTLIDLYDRRIFSRLTAGTVYEMEASDRRQER